MSNGLVNKHNKNRQSDSLTLAPCCWRYAGKAMCKLFPILLILLTSGCASYSISTHDKIDVTKGEYEVEKVNTIDEFPSNLLCFRSGKSNLIVSLGVIPTRCVDLYLVTNSEENFGIVRVTRMQGIVLLFMTFSRKWKYGFGEDIEAEISEYLVDEN